VPGGGTTSVTIQLPPLTVIELSFDGDFPLTQWSSKSAIADPVWKQSGNPDNPVCYKMESADVKLSPKVKISMEALISNIPLVSGKLEKKVQITKLTLNWSYSLDGGPWIAANSTGPHKIFQVFDTPKESPLYDLALDKSCGKCAGESQINDIAPKINSGIKADLSYDPSHNVTGTVSQPLGIYATGRCQCSNNADLLRYLCRSVGIDAEVVYIWGGRNNTETRYYNGSAGTPIGSFQVLAPPNGGAKKDPHFTFHAETKINGIIYDPSYGNVGLISLNETAPAASRQTGDRTQWISAPVSIDPWKCPH
jgi:hypothetical protein